MIQLLKQLINIPSISRDEETITDFVANYLDTCPGQYQRLGKNLLWQSPNQALNKKNIVLIGHSDTVPWNEKNWKITQPTTALEQDEKIYGRGSCDMKGGVAIMLDLIKKLPYPLPVNVFGILYHGEELGIPNGITEIIDAKILPKIDLAIILEPTNGEVVNGVFSCLDLEVAITGKACHSSRPQLGVNAIHEAATIINNLQKIPLRTIHGTTEALSVTKISGGTAVNIIPESTTLTLNMRCDPTDTLEDALQRLNLKKYQYQVTSWNAGGITDQDFSSLGKNLVEPFWTDIAQLIAAGIPAINFGPGSINQAHTADEFVCIKSLHQTHERLFAFLTTA